MIVLHKMLYSDIGCSCLSFLITATGMKARPGPGRSAKSIFPWRQCMQTHLDFDIQWVVLVPVWQHAAPCYNPLQTEPAMEGEAVSLDPVGFWRGSWYIQGSHFKGRTLKCTSMCYHIVVIKFLYSFLFLSFGLRWHGSSFLFSFCLQVLTAKIAKTWPCNKGEMVGHWHYRIHVLI